MELYTRHLLMTPLRRRTLSLTALAVTLSACGGGSDGPATNTTPPVITSQPSDASVTEGQAAVFRISVQSSTPVTYQWLRNGLPIAGATSSELSWDDASLADAGSTFSVTVTNTGGSVHSNTVKLTVQPQPWVEGIAVATGALDALTPDQRCIGISKTGDLFVWQSQNLTLTRMTSKGLPVPLMGSTQSLELNRNDSPVLWLKKYPEEIRVLEHSDGSLYVTESYSKGGGINVISGGGGRIHRLAPNGDKTTLYDSDKSTIELTPHAVVEGLQGQIYILHYNTLSIYQIPTNGAPEKFADLSPNPIENAPAIIAYRWSFRNLVATSSGEFFASAYYNAPEYNYKITPTKTIENIDFGGKTLFLANHGHNVYALVRKDGTNWLVRRNQDGSVQNIAGSSSATTVLGELPGQLGEIRLIGVTSEGRLLLGQLENVGFADYRYSKYLIVTPPV